MYTSIADLLTLLASAATVLAVLISITVSVIKIWRRIPSKFVTFNLWGTVICTILVIIFACNGMNYSALGIIGVCIIALSVILPTCLRLYRKSPIRYKRTALIVIIFLSIYFVFYPINQYINTTVLTQSVGLVLTTLLCTLIIYISTMIIISILYKLKALDSVADFFINSSTGYILISALIYLISGSVAEYIWPPLWLHISAFLQLA